MKLNEYQRLAMMTATALPGRRSLIASALGLAGEAGEVADIDKLRKRYPEGFSEERSRNRAEYETEAESYSSSS